MIYTELGQRINDENSDYELKTNDVDHDSCKVNCQQSLYAIHWLFTTNVIQLSINADLPKTHTEGERCGYLAKNGSSDAPYIEVE